LSHIDVKLESLEKVSNNMFNNKFDKDIGNIKNSSNMSEKEKNKKYSNLATKFIQQSQNHVYSVK